MAQTVISVPVSEHAARLAPGEKYFPIVTAEGFTWEPVTDGWAIGFKVTDPETGKTRYIYLNPSSSDEGGQATVFLYEGDTSSVIDAEAVCYLTPFATTEEG